MDEMQFAILGFPLGHSRSPELHNFALRHHHILGSYKKITINPAQFDQEILNLKKQHYRGFNITIPYKQRIIPYLDEIDSHGERINAVNTIKIVDGRWIGYNTDAAGFMFPLRAGGRPENTLVLGAGGAALAICHALLNHFPETGLWIANRSMPRLQSLKDALDLNFPGKKIRLIQPLSEIQNMQLIVDLIVNTTSIGMDEQGTVMPLDIALLKSIPRIVYDLIYNPAETAFLKSARENGVGRCINGWPMLVHQADRSFQIWTGKTFPKTLYRDLV